MPFGSAAQSLARLTTPAVRHLPCLPAYTVALYSWTLSLHENITLSADESLIEQARLIAKSQRKTLNAAFRERLEQFTRQSGSAQEFDSLRRLKHVRAG
jgi:hypothetical protein